MYGKPIDRKAFMIKICQKVCVCVSLARNLKISNIISIAEYVESNNA